MSASDNNARLETPMSRRRFWVCALAHTLILAAVAVWQVMVILSLNNGPSEIADWFSESNAVRAGEGFADKGFLADAGLPDVCYGTTWNSHGFPNVVRRGKRVEGGYQISTSLFPVSPTHYIYTHYPPGPDWIVGALTVIFGKQRATLYRLFPWSIALLCAAFFARQLWKTMGPARSVAAMALLAAAPMFGNMIHGLHYQTYALSLFLVEIALILSILDAHKFPWTRLVALFGVAFVQGWLSFDYCFLVAFAPLPIFLMKPGFLARDRLLRLGACVLLAGAGFALANALHVAQVILYYHDVGKAIADLRHSGSRRMGAASWSGLFARYYNAFFHDRRFFFPMAFPVGGVALALLCFPLRWASVRLGSWRISWGVPWRYVSFLAAAFVVSSLWLLFMPQHASIHTHFLPRHYFLFYFALVFLVVNNFSVIRPASDPRKGPS